ncbi:hypothetical protein BGX29_002864 [Mortierella sp. GBA35]|nr:hypothetical protein BGX29_002864 [Mortierella sp. GBA35]
MDYTLDDVPKDLVDKLKNLNTRIKNTFQERDALQHGLSYHHVEEIEKRYDENLRMLYTWAQDVEAKVVTLVAIKYEHARKAHLILGATETFLTANKPMSDYSLDKLLDRLVDLMDVLDSRIERLIRERDAIEANLGVGAYSGGLDKATKRIEDIDYQLQALNSRLQDIEGKIVTLFQVKKAAPQVE